MRLALCVLVALTSVASADDKVRWHAPKGCPDARGLRQRVEKRLERSLDDVSVGVDVDVEQRAGRYTATIDLRAVTVANDVRHLTSRRCGELADAVAVIVARVASDSLAQGQGSDTKSCATASATAGSATGDHATTCGVATSDVRASADATGAVAHTQTAFADEPSSDPRELVDATPAGPKVPRPWAFGGRIAGVSAIGVLPQVGIGTELALTFRRHDLLAEVAGTRWLASEAQIHTGRPAKLDVGLDVAVVRVGWRPATLPLRAWLAVESGSMHSTGVELPSGQLASERWVAAGAGFGIAWQMRPWIRLFGANETMLAIERARFSNGDGVVVYAPNPMSFRTICGVEIGWQ